MLDSLSFDESFRGPFLQALIKISRDTGLYPDGLLQHDVVIWDEGVFPGLFRTIRRGTHKGQVVAIKFANVNRPHDSGIIAEFSGEALLWRQLRHINVLPLLCLFRGNGHHSSIGLVSPWMRNGEMLLYISRNRNADRVSLMRDVAKGLKYLHNMKPSIIHGELMPYNILITDTHRACIADFRLSTGYQSEALGLSLPSLPGERAGLRFTAPELLSGGERIDCNISSDIYSFGCVLHSAFSGVPPFHGTDSDYTAVLRVTRGERPPRPSHCVRTGVSCSSSGLDDTMWSIVEDCWHQDPTARPTTTEILSRFPTSAPRDVVV
ncbi:kinase-like domain-containing protein [Collybia nuda]|uniref:Kinase-like domain-containing protein n=1 Tax=Collybia nuda TaxID=64659 RepID=A0A9P5XY45_9AGAR|nr:kinase-like domain-containing protein [Collybia nuda]